MADRLAFSAGYVAGFVVLALVAFVGLVVVIDKLAHRGRHASYRSRHRSRRRHAMR
jgi:uncharacterized membrane protein